MNLYLEKIKRKIFFKKNKKDVLIFDCFLFFNENDILEVRVNELKDVVDYFVIFESAFTFSKKSKDFFFDSERFKNFKTKIIYIQNQDWIKSPDAWQFESFQRNKIIDGLSMAGDKDMIILSDLDEIPKADAIIDSFYEIYKNNNKYIKLEHRNFSYWINNTSQTCPYGLSSIITKKENIKTLQELRTKQIPDVILKNAGWHYSFMSDPKDMIYKIQSYSHKEYDKWPNNDLEFIKKRISAGQSNFAHDENVFKIIKLNKKNCPKHILKNKQKYDKLIFKHEKTPIWTQIMLFYNKKICKIKEYTLGTRNKSSEKAN